MHAADGHGWSAPIALWSTELRQVPSFAVSGKVDLAAPVKWVIQDLDSGPICVVFARQSAWTRWSEHGYSGDQDGGPRHMNLVATT